MPVADIGVCRSVKLCDEWNTELADGYCVYCWDRKNG